MLRNDVRLSYSRRSVIKLACSKLIASWEKQGPSSSLDAAFMSVFIPDDTNNLIISRLNIPIRTFAGGFYKNLTSLHQHLGIPYKRKHFLYTFSTSSSTYYLYPSNLRIHQFPQKPVALSWPSHLFQLAVLYMTYTYFTLYVFYISPKIAPKHESLGSYLRRTYLPDSITRNYLLPLFPTASTCPHELLLEFPASDIIDYRRAVMRSHTTSSRKVLAPSRHGS